MGRETRDGRAAAYLPQRPAAGAMHRRDVTLGFSAPTSATGAGKPRRLLAWRLGPKGRSASIWARQLRWASERIASAPTAKFARLARHFGREETADFPSSPRFPLPTPMPNFHSAQGRPDNSRPPRRRSRRRKGRRVRSCSPSWRDRRGTLKTQTPLGVPVVHGTMYIHRRSPGRHGDGPGGSIHVGPGQLP